MHAVVVVAVGGGYGRAEVVVLRKPSIADNAINLRNDRRIFDVQHPHDPTRRAAKTRDLESACAQLRIAVAVREVESNAGHAER